MIDVFDHEHIDVPTTYEGYPAHKCVLCGAVRMDIIDDPDDCLNPDCPFHGHE